MYLFYRTYGARSFWCYKCLYSKSFGSFTGVGGNSYVLGHLILSGTVKLDQQLPFFTWCYWRIFRIFRDGTTAAAFRIGNDQWGITGICKCKNSFLRSILFNRSKVVFHFIKFHYRKTFSSCIPFGSNFHIGSFYFTGGLFLTGREGKNSNKT